jgi:hypothetical protein
VPAFNALLAISPVCDAAPPWQVLIGPFAAEHIEAELDHGAPLLLVPNNLEQAEELARLFQGRSGGGLYFSRELLGPEDREMCWYRYNDPRFDGISSPDQLRPLAPNLRLRDLELRPLVRLDSLIHGWANHDPGLAALVAAGGGRVWLQCKQPAPIVAGVSRVVEVIGEICWTPLGSAEDPASGESVLSTVSAWLESSCFQAPERRPVNAQSAAQSLIWRQDPLRLATARAQQLEAELARLREELEARQQELEGQRQAFAAERQSWQEAAEAERASLAVAQAGERSRLAEEAEAQGQELQALRQELEAQRQAFAAQEALHQSWEGQLRDWQAEREAAAAEAQVLAAARESEIAGLQAQLADQAQALRASLAVAQAEERSRLAEAAEAQGQELQALRQELEARQQELQALRQELEARQQELEALRQELEGQRQAFAAQEALHQSWEGQLRDWQTEREAAAAEAQVLAAARESEIAGLQAQLADQAQALVHQQGEAERWHAEAERQRQRLQQAAAEIDAILEALEPPPDLTAPGDAPATP